MGAWLSLLRRGSRRLGLPLADQALVSGSNFLIGVLLIRAFDLEAYGVFVLLWAVVQFAQSVQNALLISPMMSIGPRVAAEKQNEYFSSVVAWMLLFACVSAGLVLAVGETATGLMPGWWRSTYSWPLALWAFSAQMQDGLRRVLFASERLWHAFLVDTVAYGGQLLAVLALNLFGYPASAIVWAIAFVFMLSAGLAATCLRPHLAPLDLSQKTWNRHWVSSRWLLGASLFQWLSGNLILVSAAAVYGPAFTGAIKAAQNIFGLTHVVFQALENFVPAGASKAFSQKGIEGLRAYLVRVGVSVLLGTGGVAAVIAVFAAWLLSRVYNTVSEISIVSVYWYVPIYVLIALALPLRTALRTLESTKAIFVGYGIGAGCAFMLARDVVLNGGVNAVMAGILVVQIATLVPIALAAMSITRKSARS